MKKSTKKILKQFKFVRKMHQNLIGQYLEERQIGISIDEITPMIGEKVLGNEKIRLNILIPTLRKDMVFGGISTALKFFEALSTSGSFDKRIITTDSDVQPEDIDRYEGAKIVAMNKDSKSDFQIVGCNDRQLTKLKVRKNDIFIATSWWSAYLLKALINWQNKEYCTNHLMIYLIQDFEPGFYPWSSRYLLADSTYRNEISTMAVFNTSILYEYFQKAGYKFTHEFYFEPVLNEELARYLMKAHTSFRKKQIIVYGRPSVDRNCFEIIVGSLRKLLEMNEEARSWEFISLGESHKNIDLYYDRFLYSKGKVTLEEYACIMSESSIGLSLMNSPHPSYPPLEMSTFGVKTITNTYANKDLSSFNKNIISVNSCSYDHIANELSNLINSYPNCKYSISKNDEYVQTNDVFEDIVEAIASLLK